MNNASMHILLVAATPFEIAPTIAYLENAFQQKAEGVFVKEKLVVQILITGVGSPVTAFQLGAFLAVNRPDWAINAGIAGAFDAALEIGQLVQVVSERFGDLGVEEADGGFSDLAELGFAQTGLMINDFPALPGLPVCKGLTVNKVHGTETSIQKILQKYPDVQVESMEGAAFFHACLSAGIPFVEIRSISNRVESRNREAWDIPLAIKNLNAELQNMLESL